MTFGGLMGGLRGSGIFDLLGKSNPMEAAMLPYVTFSGWGIKLFESEKQAIPLVFGRLSDRIFP